MASKQKVMPFARKGSRRVAASRWQPPVGDAMPKAEAGQLPNVQLAWAAPQNGSARKNRTRRTDWPILGNLQGLWIDIAALKPHEGWRGRSTQ